MSKLRQGLTGVLVVSFLVASANEGLAAKKRAKKAAAQKPVAAANAEEIDKLKGEFSWGMSVDEVAAKIQARVREDYEERLKKTINDPTRQRNLRNEMQKDIEAVKKTHIVFQGQTTGFDVSIVDKEFEHRTGESLLTAKEDNATRYFFFVDSKLYKMFVAFDKELIGDRTFEEFADLMQEKFGKATPVMTEITRKEQKAKVLSHFEWRTKKSDALRLVDRSAFYDVYCLIVLDGSVAEGLDKKRLAMNPRDKGGDSLVNAVLNAQQLDRDENSNIIDRLTGTDHKRLGEAPPDIVVPSGDNSGIAPTPAEVNRNRGDAPAADAKKPRRGKPDTSGLEL